MKMINLKNEILQYLSGVPYASLTQIKNKVKVEEGFIIDAIADTPEIKQCGRYFNTSQDTICDYYTTATERAEAIRETVEKKQINKQINLLVRNIESELKAHHGVTTSVVAAFEYIKTNGAKMDVKYFSLNLDHVLYCYRVALQVITLPMGYTASQHYAERMEVKKAA